MLPPARPSPAPLTLTELPIVALEDDTPVAGRRSSPAAPLTQPADLDALGSPRSPADGLAERGARARRIAQSQDLPTIHQALWRELARCPGLPGHGWRQLVMASQGPDGVDARTLVLRECDDVARALVFYTDARSPKLAQLQHSPRVMLVAWDADLGWQLRLRCHMSVATHGLGVTSRWARVRCTRAAQDYLFPLASGTPLVGPPPETARGSTVPSQDADGLAHHHFAVLSARVEEIDWLEIGPPGHRRARFAAGQAHWLAP
ncbi:MAG: hypothetical protein RL722_941 [Pseudomonadota bacterium]|jgi:hypothetical protein